MKDYSLNVNKIYSKYNSGEKGLSNFFVKENRNKYGANVLTKKKSKNLFSKIIDAMLDPMLIILEIAFIITLGVNIGKIIKGIESDLFECIGILFSISLSVALTVIMEGKSQKAFDMLSSIYNKAQVKVIRNNEIRLINQTELVCGDVVFLESGDKIFADGRIIKCKNFKTDESALTGESLSVSKRDDVVLCDKTPLAERVNCVYSGTFVTEGSATVIITAVGDYSETGKIASELQTKNCISAPLQEKLSRLSKLITALGSIASLFVLILTLIKLFVEGNVTFDTVEEAFLGSIILIVASVPEGLPTTVAIALTLNVVKLSKSNALIKKLIATETVGCVSVICSDKTGTLTQNKTKLEKVIKGVNLAEEKTPKTQEIINNICINSTADIVNENNEFKRIGNDTECALIEWVNLNKKINYINVRNSQKIVEQIPFSSQIKYMQTKVNTVVYIKGAPEKIIEQTSLNYYEKTIVFSAIFEQQSKGKRVLAFAHKSLSDTSFTYDGFAVITDEIRKDVYSAVNECKCAGIAVKILTGDNAETAFWVAEELKIAKDKNEVISGYEIDNMSDGELKEVLKTVTVVARSTPNTKLKIVNALKEMGEVVAVTGDGVNDAPAIKNADIGIAMGSGSEVTKEASDIILLDNSFSTIVTAISFGRNIYLNFQRFIMFQLSVNLTAVAFIITSLILGLENPFNTLQLLWINVIMDGPPALTLGLESGRKTVMNEKPVKRVNNIITKKMFVRILMHSAIICLVLCLQYKTNFLNCLDGETSTVIFTLFILFNLFNAFNCRETGSESIFSNIKNNKLMLLTFIITFIVQVIIIQFLGMFFNTTPLSFGLWIKIILTAFTIILTSEIYKLIYRKIRKNKI